MTDKVDLDEVDLDEVDELEIKIENLENELNIAKRKVIEEVNKTKKNAEQNCTKRVIEQVNKTKSLAKQFLEKEKKSWQSKIDKLKENNKQFEKERISLINKVNNLRKQVDVITGPLMKDVNKKCQSFKNKDTEQKCAEINKRILFKGNNWQEFCKNTTYNEIYLTSGIKDLCAQNVLSTEKEKPKKGGEGVNCNNNNDCLPNFECLRINDSLSVCTRPENIEKFCERINGKDDEKKNNCINRLKRVTKNPIKKNCEAAKFDFLNQGFYNLNVLTKCRQFWVDGEVV